ncbi:MAG: PAS domain-containing protein [Alphaproteobacteria bacterium]
MTITKTSQTNPLPDRLEPKLEALHQYWDGLRRGSEVMPYWDDLDMTQLADLRANLLLLDVVDGGPRFRFSEAGTAITDLVESALRDYFIDEVRLPEPLAGLLEQCQATVTDSAATYTRRDSHARLLLPLWGNGQIQMIIGAVEKVDR